ncbi:YjjG family noncanonical pyrimidine nucleotidase [Tenacibaculum pacificus]|uniref:YjjG family noncanonical pyrimidine nucleotidase n=1 Tax=Tenacibaculum pacificus TaxID=3018314 RepID=UPI0022F3F14E|nr:YjjG family noncanonical pyrimidine nucleotidase [Tenacibaculum pacificus]WBX73074.1 YjjG family noncanonical pyrimidine nucleotidase [Tenacibaculum pacificus]
MDVKHIFFDLDHTLWDFDKNSKLTFQQIFQEQNIKLNIDDFLKVYMPVNLKYWKLYREDKISKSDLRFNRLKEVFDALNYKVTPNLIHLISDLYIKYLSTYNHLFDNTVEILKYLQQKYELHIITNGFEEIQNKKLQNSGIANYFNQIITSESIGLKKPNSKVFEFALDKVKTVPENAIMIGDSYEADVLGALNSGMLAIHFTSEIKENSGVLTINNLINLKDYL